MSRQVYTYRDLKRIDKCESFIKLRKYPQITVSADLRKCLNGREKTDKVKGLVSDDPGFRVTEFNFFGKAIDESLNSDKSKFTEMVLLSEFVRNKLDMAGDDRKMRNHLTGCLRNLDSMLSAIILLEQAGLRPEELTCENDKNLALFTEAWSMLAKKDPAIAGFRSRMSELTEKASWESVFLKAFSQGHAEETDTVVFHGFYYITPYQERVMRLMEAAGFKLIFLIPYDERYPYAYEIWDKTYSVEKGFEPKSSWHMDRSECIDPYGEIFEGRKAIINNRLEIREYASVIEFANDVKYIREDGFSIYSADYKSANRMLRDYFPEEYGDRKMLSYPIGQFISTLNRLWDDETKTISLDEEKLIECFSSGWLAIDGISGKQYMQDLMYVLPFFNGCRSAKDWEKRIELFEEIRRSAISPFETVHDSDASVSRWQEAMGSPFKNFSIYAVGDEKLSIIFRLIRQLLHMAEELFGKNEPVQVHNHIRTLDFILRKHEVSQELYLEERELVKDIFEKLGADNSFDAMCYPSDIARALEFFISGRYDEGEVQTNKVGMIYPLYFVDAACVKNKGKVHLCMSDVESLPGRNKDYIWPLTERKMKEVYASTQNPYIMNLIHVMGSAALCNRYFTYCALKNKEVTISWISTVGEKLLAPSPYIKMLMDATGTVLIPAVRDTITFSKVADAQKGPGRIRKYEKAKAPSGMIKEARMDYVICPMKYVLGYVLEKYPVYQSDFQMNYALNAFISAVYDLMKDKGISVEQAYEAVIALFPNMRRAEKRQVYDYISYDHGESDMDYGCRTECGGKLYTDERLKLHYPNQDVRKNAIIRYSRPGAGNSDAGKEMNLYETSEVPDACTFCQHVSYCRNAQYTGDQENYYD